MTPKEVSDGLAGTTASSEVALILSHSQEPHSGFIRAHQGGSQSVTWRVSFHGLVPRTSVVSGNVFLD